MLCIGIIQEHSREILKEYFPISYKSREKKHLPKAFITILIYLWYYNTPIPLDHLASAFYRADESIRINVLAILTNDGYVMKIEKSYMITDRGIRLIDKLFIKYCSDIWTIR